jgi:hypothetical protein
MSAVYRFRTQGDGEPSSLAIVFDHVEGYCAGYQDCLLLKIEGRFQSCE